MRKRDLFLKILEEVRVRYRFYLVGFVLMPEHFHLLISESKLATPSRVMQVLKQRVSRAVRHRRRRNPNQFPLWRDGKDVSLHQFWQRRFYDFNVWSRKKHFEKLHYMHMNPVKRGLVVRPEPWPWSSYHFYQYGEKSLCHISREPE